MIDLVYYSSASGNTKAFVDSLTLPEGVNVIRLSGVGSPPVQHRPYVLVVSTYADVLGENATHIDVEKFLSRASNVANLAGVVAGGNRNFGKMFALSGRNIARRFGVPLLHEFELTGAPEDAVIVQDEFARLIAEYTQMTNAAQARRELTKQGDISPDILNSVAYRNKDYHSLNAMLNLFDSNGEYQLDADRAAARAYFLQHVNQNTVFFHSLKEKLDYLLDEGYYERDVFEQYDFPFIKSLFKEIYSYKFRFETFLGAFKYYTSYTLKTFDGTRYLERFEDRVCTVALYLARGNESDARRMAVEMITGRFQPATPTFLNAGKCARGELVSCFLLRVEDNMESISRSMNGALQLSKRGGGVALNMTNIRERGAPIKGVAGLSSGLVPILKLYEDSFLFSNQLGARPGAGAVWLNAHHMNIFDLLDTKRENADEKVRIKSLSIGVVIPDITFELAARKEPMYLFSSYDIERVYGIPMSDISITEKYYEMVNDPRIGKKMIDARDLFKRIADIQFESGYPYILYEDTANRSNPIAGRINMSNLCSEILQVSEISEFNEDLSYKHIGRDISCNLGSMNIAKSMDGRDLGNTVEMGIRMLTAVSELSSLDCVPSIRRGNEFGHAIGLGQMNLHGFLARELVKYGVDEGLELTDAYFRTVLFHSLRASNLLAQERGRPFSGFDNSTYATGAFFEPYVTEEWVGGSQRTMEILQKYNVQVPTVEEWVELKYLVMEFGIYNQNLQAIPPTGSISYINNSTSSIHPIASRIEVRKEGQIGRVYYPAPYLSKETAPFYEDAYEIGYKRLIDTYAVATKYVDQGLSLTLFMPATATTRDINNAQIYAWTQGVKTLYYIRLRQVALEGTEIEGCVSCSL